MRHENRNDLTNLGGAAGGVIGGAIGGPGGAAIGVPAGRLVGRNSPELARAVVKSTKWVSRRTWRMSKKMMKAF